MSDSMTMTKPSLSEPKTLQAAMQQADALAAGNTRGGPFGAVILGADGSVIGEGRNEVVATCDPTAHAEMQALRDAAQKNPGKLAGATLVTSCECCPMCLAGAYAAGIGQIIYGNTRQDAAAIGFADDAIYEEMHVGLDALAITRVSADNTQAALLPQNAQAAVVNATGELLGVAGKEDAHTADAVGLPSVLAVSRACRTLEQFHLPPGCKLIVRGVVHPLGFTAARWAHVADIFVVDDGTWEGDGAQHHPQAVYEDIALPLTALAKRRIPMRRYAETTMLDQTKATFDRWFADMNKVMY